jgi:uncharacterized protein involved in exopolysaccharide biosynthesis
MSRILDSLHSADASLGSHYEEKVRLALANVWRNKLLLIATAAAALVIGIALTLAMPKRYTAEAYIRGVTTEEAAASDGKNGAIIGLDASVLVQTRSHLLQSQQFARQVVKRLGLERIRAAGSESPFTSWLHAKFYGDAAGTPEFQVDMAARKLLQNLSVKTEPREYLITLRYPAENPEMAALIANTFVVEFCQTIALQILYRQRDAAQSALSKELATLGEKHPRVLEARVSLEYADAALKAQQAKTSEEIERTAGATATFAQAAGVPSSPNPPFLIGLALLVGLVGGIAIVMFRGRAQGGYYRPGINSRLTPHVMRMRRVWTRGHVVHRIGKRRG